MRRGRHIIGVAACVLGGTLVAAAPAVAAVPDAPLALFGIDVGEIVEDVADAIFGALANALMPDFLKQAGVGAIKALVALPNPASAQWQNVGQLRSYMTQLGLSLLTVTMLIAALRFWAGGMAGGVSPIAAVTRTGVAAFGLVIYPWAFANGIAFVNVVTNQILSWSVVSKGLTAAVGTMFGTSLVVGAGGPFIALLLLVTIIFAAALFVMKIALMMLATVLFIAGPLVIAFYPLPETERFFRWWLVSLLMVTIIPIGWCVLFATAGALALDTVAFGAGLKLDKTAIGAFTTLVTFGVAALWPLSVLRHANSVGALFGAGGVGTSALRAGGGGGAPGGARVQMARAQLRAGTMAVGRQASQLGAAVGMPRGGLAGGAARGGAKLAAAGAEQVARSPAVAAAAGAVAAAAGAGAARAGSTRLAQSGPARALGERASRGAAVIGETPGAVKSAMREARTQAAPRAGPGAREGRAPDVDASKAPAGERPVVRETRPTRGATATPPQGRHAPGVAERHAAAVARSQSGPRPPAGAAAATANAPARRAAAVEASSRGQGGAREPGSQSHPARAVSKPARSEPARPAPVAKQPSAPRPKAVNKAREAAKSGRGRRSRRTPGGGS